MISCRNTKKCFPTQGISTGQVPSSTTSHFYHRHRHHQIYNRNLSPSLRKDAIKQKCTSGGILVNPF